MRAALARWDPSVYYSRMMETYILALEGRGDVIVSRIRDHDHVAMGWLAYAASEFVRSPQAREALEWGATSLPDESCRRQCSRFLNEGKST